MTPIAALTHVCPEHGSVHFVRFWRVTFGHTDATIMHYPMRKQYDLRLFCPGGVLPGPHIETWHSAREVLTELRKAAVAESADTTAIDHALTHLQEP